ncbi:uncharacterized protein LOC124887050 [Capsicum annuum]|uniref:uncharacterized protein LOC124887050 n=1 Tax=Capsicum annuum TaxID=4072 RepID=UPI001FB098E9|nr:uncharacterized protein LOC124887050 [Capsicum annuum]
MNKFVTREKTRNPRSSSTRLSASSSVALEIWRQIFISDVDLESDEADSEIRKFIAKYIVDSCAKEIIKAIIEDLGGDYFKIPVDESKDVSHKEQMTRVLKSVNKEGEMIKRFIGIVHVTLVALAKKNSDVDDFFCLVINVLNIVGASFKCRDLLREHQAEKLEELLISGEVHIGREFSNYIDKLLAKTLMSEMKKFDFVFMLHLIWKVLIMTNKLSFSFQWIDQHIINAMGLVALTKQRLQNMRDGEFESLIDDVSLFCGKYDIMIPEKDANYFPGKSKRKAIDITYSHHLRVEIFYAVIDLHLDELNNRFNAISTDLLLGLTGLNPVNSYDSFDKGRIMKLVECYMNEFDSIKLCDLNCQLDSFIVYAC